MIEGGTSRVKRQGEVSGVNCYGIIVRGNCQRALSVVNDQGWKVKDETSKLNCGE